MEGVAAPYELNMEDLIEQFGTMVLRQAFLYLKDRQKAEDACQEVFLRMFRKQPFLPDDQSRKAYLLRVTINVCKDMLKSAWHRRTTALADGYEAPWTGQTPEASALESERKAQLWEAVLSLPLIYKDVILLFYYHDYSTAQIAKILKVPEVTVRTRLMRARQRLSAKLTHLPAADEP